MNSENAHGVSSQLTRQQVADELERARVMFHRLLNDASPADLHRGSNGTRWTNEQLLFHMLFGYLIVRALRPLVKGFGRLPAGVSRGYAAVLDAAHRPFDVINYWGSCGGARLFRADRMGRAMDRVIASLQRHLDAESERSLARRMHYPTRWDPFFTDSMTLLDVYHYGTEHFDFHRAQLTLGEES